jgi:hypothetical protein
MRGSHNNAVERTAGSHALAAAAHREHSPHRGVTVSWGRRAERRPWFSTVAGRGGGSEKGRFRDGRFMSLTLNTLDQMLLLDP